jgi:hypothetical protein
MADESGLSPFYFACEGGLILNRSTFAMQPGMALELENFEPDVGGGYRRINGFQKWNSNVVPQTSSSSESVLMSAFFEGNNKVIAARGEKVFEAGTTGSWTEIDTGRSNANKYTFFRYNLGGTDHIVWADGANHATKYDGTTVTDLNATGAPANPKFVVGFKDALFFAGHSANPEEVVFTAPFTEDDFRSAQGAGSFKVDSKVVGLKVFRNELFIFCQDRIYKLLGSTLSDFAVQEVTRNIGCRDGGSIQEIGGDVIFLAPDGLRTIAGTARIGDVELGSISRQIQTRIDEVILDRVSSLVIRDKSQYRLFYPETAGGQSSSKGIIGVLKSNVNTNQIGFEFSDMIGIKPACTDSDFISNVETQVFGGFDGYIYKMEVGNTFANGATNTTIVATYRSPDMVMGDPGLRKYMQRVNLNYEGEGTAVDAELAIRYDYDSSNTPQPNKISITICRWCSFIWYSIIWQSIIWSIRYTTYKTNSRRIWICSCFKNR